MTRALLILALAAIIGALLDAASGMNDWWSR